MQILVRCKMALGCFKRPPLLCPLSIFAVSSTYYPAVLSRYRLVLDLVADDVPSTNHLSNGEDSVRFRCVEDDALPLSRLDDGPPPGCRGCAVVELLVGFPDQLGVGRRL